MSLSARIALAPSRRIAWAEQSLATAGVFVAGAAMAGRWPDQRMTWLACMLVAALASTTWCTLRRRDSVVRVLAFSDRATIDVLTTEPDPTAGVWRLTETTLLWQGFALVALVRDGSRRVLRMPLLLADLTSVDRRSLGRLLLWSMRERRHGLADAQAAHGAPDMTVSRPGPSGTPG